MTTQTIDVQQLAGFQNQAPLCLVDVRTPVEFRAVHAVGARNIPLDSIGAAAITAARGGSTDAPVYVICKSGGRSTKACQKLVDAGVQHIVNVTGGTDAWESAGLPVQRGKKAMSLERQVRIAAGGLVFTGALLGFFVNPNFIGISAFVGAGLVFAGITDTCAMGLMIAKMPWNRA